MVVPVVMFIGNPDGSVTLIQREEEKRWSDEYSGDDEMENER